VIICLLNTLNNNNDDNNDNDRKKEIKGKKKGKGRKAPKWTQLKFYEVLTVPMLNSYCENCTLDWSSVKTKILPGQVKILTSEAGFTLIETEIQKCGTNLIFTV
jgi:hypothetical protein